MIIGVPKEIKLQEHRVALLPSAVYQLIKRGHQVVVERSAGAGSGYRYWCCTSWMARSACLRMLPFPPAISAATSRLG
jgi:hypothetical protein